MVVQWLSGVAHFAQQLLIPLVSVITTIVTVVFTIGAIKKRNIDDLTEATTTWHEIADSRKEELEKKELTIADLKIKLAQKDRRIEFLWSQLSAVQKDSANAKGPTQ